MTYNITKFILYIYIITGVSLEFHVVGISNVAGGTLAGHVPGLEICGILVANATMFSHLLPGLDLDSKSLLPPKNEFLGLCAEAI